VTICNTANPGTGLKWYSVELTSGTFVGCEDTFNPEWYRTPAYWGLQPGECASFEVTLQRPDILDALPSVCFRVSVTVLGGGTASLGIIARDSEVACAHWGFYEAEWARFLHPGDPVAQEVELASVGTGGMDVFYEVRAVDGSGAPLFSTISLDNQEPGVPLRGYAVLGPGETWPVAFELTWTDAEVAGPVELALMADLDFDGSLEQLSSIPLFNAEVFSSGGQPADAPTAAPALARAGLQVGIAPNPFNPAGVVSFELAAPGLACVDILDPRGRAVRTLVEAQQLAAGKHERRWDGRDAEGGLVANGVYLVRVRVDDATETKRAVLLK
jgi:hypothetical protein